MAVIASFLAVGSKSVFSRKSEALEMICRFVPLEF